MVELPIARRERGLELRARVTPKASRDAIGAVVADEQGNAVLKIAVTAVPEKGGANAAVIRLLTKSWKLRRTDLDIIRGATDRNKTILIRGDNDELDDLYARVRDALTALTNKGESHDER